MKVLLIAKHSIVEPLGIMFLCSVLRDNGHEVEVSLIQDAKDSNLLQKVCQSNYDLIGLSAYTGFHKTIFELSNYFRSRGLKTVIGGSHATFFSSDCLNYADYVVRGEGFKSILSVLDGTKKGIVFNPQLVPSQDIPIPYREPIYTPYLSFRVNPIKNVITSFGCPYSCSYCYNDSYKKLYPDFKIRQRSVSSTIEECRELKRYPLKLIYFEDDCFGLSLEWLTEFSVDYKNLVNVPFHCQLRPEMVTQDRLELLKAAGCQGITMAIETSNEEVRRDLLNRKTTNNEITNACNLVKKYNIKLRIEQMLGLPNTTLEDELDLLKLNVFLKPDMSWVSIYSPYLGTTLGDYCKAVGLYSGNNNDLSDSFFSNSALNFSSKRLINTNTLHKIFSTCALFKNGQELAKNYLILSDFTLSGWFNATRKHLFDNYLYST